MILSERWMRKIQGHELKIQMKRLMIEAKKLEHNLNILKKEHEEEKRAAYELSLKLEKQLKRKRCYECREYGHLAADCTNRDMIFQEYERPMNHFSKDHGVEVDEEMVIEPYPTHDLFHNAPIDHVVWELNDPPIYDSYELEDDAVSSLSALANEEIAETVLKQFCATLEQQGPDVESNPWRDELGKAAMPIFDEYLEAHERREPAQLVCEADHEAIHQVCEIGCQVEVLQPDLKHLSPKPDLLGLHIECSPSILKGDEVLHNEGLKFGAAHEYSDLNALVLNLISLAAAQFGLKLACSSQNPTIHVQAQLIEPFVAPMNTFSSLQNSEYSRANTFKNCYTFKKKGVHSDLHDMLALGAQAESKGKDHVLLFLGLYGGGLLDLCIEDDELKDNAKCYFSQSKYATCIKASL